MESNAEAPFDVGEVVVHKLFDYRGVVYDIDPVCSLADAWYEAMARSKPPKGEPWYHILVDGEVHTTYVAQRNLKPDGTNLPVVHPLLSDYFYKFDGATYVLRVRAN